MITVTSTEARERFAELLENVEQGPVAITREGQPAAFLVSAAEIDEMVHERWRAQSVAAFKAWSAETERRAIPEAAALTDEEVNRLVHELR